MNIYWDAEKYKQDFMFVPEYGAAVLDLLDAAPGARVVDLGCGNGALTRQLADRGYQVLGVDASPEQLALARQAYPDLTFREGNALDFALEQPADAIFSNAVLHWIDADKQQAMLDHIASQIRPEGLFVCEFGGKGCAEHVHAELERRFAAHGLHYRRTFYFPTIGEYAPLLEKAGFRVEYATLFDRPTRQVGSDGLADWIRMFDTAPFADVEPALADTIIAETVDALRPVLYHDDAWYVDYVRIRFKLRKL